MAGVSHPGELIGDRYDGGATDTCAISLRPSSADAAVLAQEFFTALGDRL
jgi:hypothetical protein